MKAVWPARCEGITASGEQCKCFAVQRINDIPYCKQHAQKELAVAIKASKTEGLKAE